MAKQPKTSTIGEALETTIIFSPKTLIEELTKAKRDTKKRTSSMNRTLGEKIKEAVENKHLDRKAFSIACQLEAMDDERLHVTYHSLLKYCEDNGVTKRATAQEELFDPNAAGEEKEPEGKVSGGGEKEPKTRSASGPRLVPESAGSDKPH